METSVSHYERIEALWPSFLSDVLVSSALTTAKVLPQNLRRNCIKEHALSVAGETANIARAEQGLLWL